MNKDEINYGDTIKYTTADGIEVVGEVVFIDSWSYTVNWRDVVKYVKKEPAVIMTEGYDHAPRESAVLVKKLQY